MRNGAMVSRVIWARPLLALRELGLRLLKKLSTDQGGNARYRQPLFRGNRDRRVGRPADGMGGRPAAPGRPAKTWPV